MAHVPTVAAEDSDTTDADEERAFPFGSYPCVQCQALVAKGMLFCLRCTAPQTDDSAKVTKRFFEDQKAANTEQLAEQNRQVAVGGTLRPNGTSGTVPATRIPAGIREPSDMSGTSPAGY